MKKQTTLAAALVLGLAAPAFAQDGFRVGIQAGSMKTTGEAGQFATVPQGGLNNAIGYDFDQATQAPLALDLAYVKGDDEWSLTYFTTKKKTDKTIIDATNGVFLGSSIIFITADAGLTGSRELKATVIDLAWKHTLVKGDTGAFAFSAGLRYSKQSDERSYIQVDPSGTPNQGTLHMKGTGTGFGLTAGLHGRMNFTDRMWLTTGFTAAMLNNTAKSDDYTATNLPPFGDSSYTSEDTHSSLLQTDAYLRFNMTFVKSFNGYLGYEVRDFNKDAVKTSPNFLSGSGFPATSGFGLAGFTLGLSYTF
ncbi:MAG TPA: hypothetical protein VFM16_07300 [Holophagaceae bacterium]|nr:hypothetical protein [Holophagaceae bacterium]